MKKELKISEVIGYFISLKRMEDDKLVGLCPFHPDTSQSLVIDDSIDIFYCTVCEAKGGSLNFVSKFKAISLEDAQKFIQGIPSEVSEEIYSSTITGKMKIKDGVTVDELSCEANDLDDFITSIEKAPKWRDVSIAELIERTKAVMAANDKIPNERKHEEIQGKLLKSFLRLTQISYRFEFGHNPYCYLESNEVSRWVAINEERFRKEKNPIVQFAANTLHRIRKFFGISLK